MNKARLHRHTRRWHRYLGVIFGIQFLFWTLGGLYFSWTNIKTIRGEDLRKEEPVLLLDSCHVSVSAVIRRIKMNDTVQYIKTVQLVEVLGRVYYQVAYYNGTRIKVQLAGAQTGEVRAPLTGTEAIAVAKSRISQPAKVTETRYLMETNDHHEYRGKPLPAYAVSFTGNINTTVYVATEYGTVQSFRNNRWRIFDFLWMMHTMDYKNRDNINNQVLRIFSALGLVTILSGFCLYGISYKKRA